MGSLSACEEFKIVFDGNKKRDAKRPRAMKYIKYFKVCSHPTKPRLYFVNNGDKKYPTEAAAVTMPVAIVLLSFGKCFPTSETGTPIAVAPRAIPTNTPRLI